ncbi:DUF2812 domain-containing protein [Clostridium sp. MCC353]|uniref:DUF2812 domain-containing protein n=1 Tax=Clostridium sp. MCC353 TaxID=2592646 RepID=UPI001C00FCB3|nr:DUF2812 domain-containing protein [Clostridium sp. MCC353]MBT9776439.1 DUF2812 domain-containing protein [Clostridium sp. MCC353]
MNEYHKYTIPCSLLDVRGLERFLESKAEKGNLIRGFSKWGGTGTFEEVLEGNYHICIDVYRKKLSEKDEGNPEFLEYIDECETVGWHYSCFYKNLVFFYSSQEERPLELKRNQIAAKQYLYDITQPEEKKCLLYQSFNSLAIFAVWFVFLLLGVLKTGRGQDTDLWIYCMIFLTGLLCTNLTGVMAKYLQNLKIGKGLLSERQYIIKPSFWDEDMLTAASLLATGFLLFLLSHRIFAVKSAILSSCAVIISAVLLGAGRIRYHRKREWKFPLAVKAFCIVPLVLLAVSVTANPTSGSYRYQTGPGADSFVRSGMEEELKELGLRPETLGWEKTDFTFLHENKNPLCTYEYLVYDVEGFDLNSRGSRDYEKSLRYVGTLIAELKNTKSLNRYLKQKEISLKRSSPIELLPEVSSYIEESGKVLFHIKGDRIVLFFLNEYDDRVFDTEDQGKLEVLRETLTGILDYEK